MHIVIATPLFPPDVVPVAGYAKELTKRLAQTNQVSVVLYGHLPESVSGARFICVDKRKWRIVRVMRYLYVLLSTVRNADLLLVINGPSTELPALVAGTITRIPLMLLVADQEAANTLRIYPQKIVTWVLNQQATNVITLVPPPPPEIIPFDQPPQDALVAWDAAWTTHCSLIVKSKP